MSKHVAKVIVIAPKLGTAITVKTTVERKGSTTKTTQESDRTTIASNR